MNSRTKLLVSKFVGLSMLVSSTLSMSGCILEDKEENKIDIYNNDYNRPSKHKKEKEDTEEFIGQRSIVPVSLFTTQEQKSYGIKPTPSARTGFGSVGVRSSASS